MFATAFLDLPPLQKAAGTVALPGSKSISNRVLLLAALSRGETVVHDLLDSDDTRVMLAALQQLGCGVQDLSPGSKRITGLGGKFATAAAPQRIFLGNAGTAMRPLTAALALAGGEFELSGVPRMHERPIGDLVDALRQLGCRIDCTGQDGFPPLRIHPPQFIDGWHQRPIRVRGDVSSQFLTALLLALPLTAGEHDITIEVIGELISRPYIEITLNMLARFGVSVQREGWQRFTIAAGSRYQSPGEIHVEADASSASYFIAMGAMAATREEPLLIQGLGLNSIQGDIRFVEAARAMGAQVQGDATSLRVHRSAWPLRAVNMDCNHIPDAAMTLAVMALYADGPCTFTNIASWRVKETDRIHAVASECRRLGALVEEGEDWLRVHPLARGNWQAATIQTYDDHRMAMCFSLAAFNPDAQPVRIMDPKCVGKTFPEYFETLFALASTAADHIPVICIDGPSASGKGTLASALAAALGYHWLDSGALYRAVAIAAAQKGVALEAENESALADIAARLPLHFEDARIFLDGADVTDAIRSEAAGMGASRVSALPAVRNALQALQRSFRRLPGLVSDGRDMGTVIFPQADLKVFLTASTECRAQRRHKQLIFNGISANICDLRADLGARDARDASRAVAPLKPAQDALLLDSSGLTVEETVARVLQWWQARRPFAPEAA